MPGIMASSRIRSGVIRLDQREGLRAARRNQGHEAVALERLGQKPERVRRVVDHENDARGRFGPVSLTERRSRSLASSNTAAKPAKSNASKAVAKLRRQPPKPGCRPGRRAWPRCRAHSRCRRGAAARRCRPSPGRAIHRGPGATGAGTAPASIHSRSSWLSSASSSRARSNGFGTRAVVGIALPRRREAVADIGRQHDDRRDDVLARRAARGRGPSRSCPASRCRGRTGRGGCRRPWPGRSRASRAVSTEKPSGSRSGAHQAPDDPGRRPPRATCGADPDSPARSAPALTGGAATAASIRRSLNALPTPGRARTRRSRLPSGRRAAS